MSAPEEIAGTSSPRPAPPPSLPAGLALAAALLVVLFLVYAPALHGEFVWDDHTNIVENPNMGSADGLRRLWTDPLASQQYYPLTHTSFWINHRVSGLEPFGYHVTNVVLHAGNALLLWLVLASLGVPAALPAAILFALHPVQVESVAWITERKNVLAALLMLGSTLAYLRFSGIGARDGAEKPREEDAPWGWYALALSLFCLALLAKTAVAPLPAVLAVLIWWKRGRVARTEALRLVPFLVLAAGAAAGTAWLEAHHVGVAREDLGLGTTDRLVMAGRASWFYVGKVLWPDLSFIYPRWNLGTAGAFGLLFPLSVIAALTALGALRRHIGRGPLAATLCYGLLIAPAIGVVDLFFFRYSLAQDHFQYLASMASIALLAGAAATALRRVRAPAALSVALAVLAVLGLGALARERAGMYRTEEGFWRTVLDENPDAWIAHTNLGNLLVRTGRTDEAMGHLERSVELQPALREGRQAVAVALLDQGRTEEAAGILERLVEEEESPGALVNLGHALLRLGRADEAEPRFRRALELPSGRPFLAHAGLADALVARGRPGEALVHYAEALRMQPDLPRARSNLARALYMVGRRDEALDQIRETIARDPGYALGHHRLGLFLDARGETDAAVAAFRESVRLDPGLAAAWKELDRLLSLRGDGAGAAEARRRLEALGEGA